MHVLYVHQSFPAQFGHIARQLAGRRGWRCTFASQAAPGIVDGIETIQYQSAGGATADTHFCSRTFENQVWQCDAVYQALKKRPDIRPDLIVGHSGFGSTLFLRELYPDVPIVNFFEYYYRPHEAGSDMDYRTDLGWPVDDLTYLRARSRNAMLLLDLENCDAAYTPTAFQRERFPQTYQPKLEVIFDGVDREIYHGFDEALRPAVAQRSMRRFGAMTLAPATRLVTYVSRGFESMRGFDVFMRSAKRIAALYPDVHFAVVGTDRIAYGGDERHIAPARTFKEWVLSREEFDLSRFSFLGHMPPTALAQLLAASDLHIYLTVPFTLSWSMINAMSCGAVVLGSATAPVREVIRDGENGLLADFFDVEEIAQKAVGVLRDPAKYRPLGRAAEQLVREQYSLEAALPRMLGLYERALESRGAASCSAMPGRLRRAG
jgi:glycosyltransferase involved in cell wall biosynthesis